MKDTGKTKNQLLEELAELRQHVAKLEQHNTTLDKERSLLRIVIDTIPYPIYAKDTEKRFLVANETVAHVMGTTPDVLLGKTDYDFYSNELAEAFSTDEQTIIETGQPLLNKDEPVVDLSGREARYLTSKIPFYDDQGNIQGIIGIGQDMTERKRAEEQIQANVHFLEHLDQVNRAIQQSNDVEQLLETIIGKVFSIFDCDRAWLLYPCDPDTSSFRVPWEKTRPEYPGAKALNLEIPMTPGYAQYLQDILASENPVTYTVGTERPVTEETVTQFNVQAQMLMTVYPIIGKPWVFGMHQCAYARIWTQEEQRLFKEIGQRLGDALGTLLTLRNLRESEAKLREAQRMAHIGNWWWDVKSGTVEWSEEVYHIFCLNPEEFTLDIDSILTRLPWVGGPEQSQQTIQEVVQKAQTSHDPGTFEARFFRPDGSIGYFFSTFQGIYDDEGELIAIKGTAQNITERRQAEQAQAIDSSRYKGLFEQTNDAVYIVSLEDTFLAVNQRGADILGYTADELVGQPIEISVAHSERTEAKAVLAALKAGGVLPVYERIFKKKNGQEFPAEVNVALVNDPDGHPLHIQSVVRDITERKQAEAALRASEEKYRLLFDRADVLISVYDRDGVCQLMNRKVAALFNGEPEDFIGKSFADLHTENADEYTQRIRQAIDFGIVQDFEDEVAFPTDSRWLLSRVHPIPAAHGASSTAQIISHDITERKQMEQSLSESEERYRIISELISDYAFAWAISPDGSRKHLWTTEDSFTRLTGHPYQEPTDTFNLYHPDDKAIAQQHVAETKAGKPTEGEYRIITKSGEVRWINLHRQPIWDEQEQRVIRYYGAAQDITERKLAEQALHIQRDLGLYLSTTSDLADAANRVLDAILQIGEIDCGRVYLVDQVTGDFSLIAHQGLSPEFITATTRYTNDNPRLEIATLGQPIYRLYNQLAGPLDAIRENEELRAAAVIPIHFKDQLIATLTLASHTHDTLSERTRHVLETIAAQVGGSIAHIQAKEALRESEERYRIVSELISDYAFAWAINPDGSRQHLWITEDSFTRLTGQPWPKNSDPLLLIHPDDHAAIQQHMAETLQGGKSTEGEYRIITKSGEIRWINLRRQPIWDEQEQRVTRYYGVVQDITERKLAEKALHIQRDLGLYLGTTSDLADAASHVLDAILQIGEIDCGRVYLVDPVDQSHHLIAHRGLSPEFIAVVGYYPKDTPQAQIALPAKPVYHLYEQLSSEPKDAIRLSEGLRAAAVIPLHFKEQVIANLSLASHTHDTLSERTRHILETIAAQVGGSIAHIQAKEALRESEERYRIVSELISDYAFAWAINPDGSRQHLWITEDSFTRLTGYSWQEVANNSSLFHPDDEVAAQQHVAVTLQGKPTQGEYRIITKSGEVRWINLRRQPIWDEQEQRVTRYYGVAQDITERKLAEQALRLNSFALEHATDAIYWVHEAEIIDVNEAACQMLGYSHEEFSGMSLTTIDPLMPETDILKVWDYVKKEGTSIFETQHKTKDGDIVPVEIMANYHEFEDRELICCFVRDITERKRTEEALLRSEERLRQAVRAGNIGILDHDHIQNTIYLSPEYQAMIGGELQEPVTMEKLLRLMHPDDVEKITLAAQHANDPSGDGNYHVQHRIIDRSGTVRWLNARAHTFFEGEGDDRHPVRTVGATADITEHKLMEQQRLEFALEKERSDTLHMLMGNIAHDIKTPLAIINTSLYLLEKHTDPVKQQEKLNNIKGQVHILSSFIHDMVAIARLDTEPELRLVPVDVNELVMDIETETQPLIEQKRITFTLDLAEDMLPIQADQTDLRRALINLVENALNYTPSGHTVTVRTRKHADEILVEVMDTGMGINGTDLPHIFDRFYRSAQAQSIISGGSGLGLAIVQRVVEMHGGTVEVTSEPSTGTTFRIQLPMN